IGPSVYILECYSTIYYGQAAPGRGWMRSTMQTLAELFDRNARFFPEREALVCDGVRRTHAQYAERARRLASGLHGLGLRCQDRFAILAMNCLEFYEAYAASEYSATILVPINFRLAP